MAIAAILAAATLATAAGDGGGTPAGAIEPAPARDDATAPVVEAPAPAGPDAGAPEPGAPGSGSPDGGGADDEEPAGLEIPPPLAADTPVDELIELLRSDDPWTRQRAANAFGRRERPPAFGRLVPLLLDERPGVRASAAWALERIGRPARGAAPALAPLVLDPSHHVRVAAVMALGNVDPDPDVALPALVRALGDERREVRQYAAQSIGLLGPAAAPATRALVISLDNDPEWQVRLLAARSLGQIGPDAAGAHEALFRRVQEDDTLGVRRESAHALAIIHGEQPVPPRPIDVEQQPIPLNASSIGAPGPAPGGEPAASQDE